ncbi:uncharacterized protein K452DRAFT_300716 [Aplosporella prunicola CBS 121167]|uniref:DUF8032 domain-containing protein n=1 Tax=Aplosporella prunicola CBS 121167 TaxID=1176127 RepID=A0A6A6B6A3_9PEZI|nr:uncharacterized protein K452DRAFT_300716 [Aplosporella prunicola CBS 121167]KAF2139168.1 hypothetical protein K452DRAFT_300716 [Aplosporella prunicola CBS 121167]
MVLHLAAFTNADPEYDPDSIRSAQARPESRQTPGPRLEDDDDYDDDDRRRTIERRHKRDVRSIRRHATATANACASRSVTNAAIRARALHFADGALRISTSRGSDRLSKHHPHPAQQGLPPPQHIQHPRPQVIQHHQHHPNSPQQPSHPSSQGPYASPHPSTHQVPNQHHSPYVSTIQVPHAQNPQEVPYYAATAHPSPYSTNSASGSYTSSAETPDISMATATMNRQFPPIYHTPQSNSPASIQSPQHDQHGRPIYGQSAPQVPQQMYYSPQYQMPPQQSPYAQQHPAPLAANSLLMSHQPQPLQHPQHPHTPGLPGSPRAKLNQTPLQRPPSGLGPPQGTPTGPPGSAGSMHSAAPPNSSVNPNAAPGPIPATTPLVVRQDQNGVQWIAFEYSRDRVKMEYTIRCDVESVNVDELPQEFKTENCVYPRACCSKDQYKGNRLHYETECNTVGWALAQLNPCLRGKRGLIQRAVDSWRNSNQDPRLRSRRVRRMAKITSRKAIQASQHGGHMAGPGAPGAAGVPNSAGLPGAPGPRPTSMGMGGPQLHHHHEHPGGAPGGPDDVSAANGYNDTTHTHHHQAPTAQTNPPSGEVRTANNFYPTYPTAAHAVGGPAMPPTMHHVPPPPPAHATSASTKSQEDEERNLELFGDLPEAKRRKFILVEDAERSTRVRVRVMLDQVNMEEMPDSYRKSNSVYPRSYFPTQMQSPPASPRGRRFFDDPEDEKSDDGSSAPVTGRTLVPVPLMDGSEAKVPRPVVTKSKRNKEVTLNDLGYRMTWSQSRVFAGRTLFLQRSLDAYRTKMRTTMMAAGQDVAPHFETRVGKRQWLERSKRAKREASP